MQDGIMQAVINLHPSVAVGNCCNDKNKTKELLEGDTCRYEGGTSQGHHSHFFRVGICVEGTYICQTARGNILTSYKEQMYVQ